ncbi:MAG: hypothetical protein QM764_21555 [Chitinophagaceae bacterium]
MKRILFSSILFFLSCELFSQDNYEIQVYGSQTQLPKTTMFELHSNYTFDGDKNQTKGVLPSNHALHETLEITTGITSNFEIGAYLFTAYVPGHGYQVVGSHLRPRIMAPAKWQLPVGLSLSTEIGYQRADYSSSTWSIEIRPIIDKQWQKWYVSLNPTLGISLKSRYDKSTPTFEPNVKLYYTIAKNAGLGIEYYGDIGYVNSLEKWPEQSDAIFMAYDLLNNAKWEFNMGAGIGVTQSTDRFVYKIILGRKINWQRNK